MNQYETLLNHVRDNGTKKFGRTVTGTLCLLGYLVRLDAIKWFLLNPTIKDIFYYKYKDFQLKGCSPYPGIKGSN